MRRGRSFVNRQTIGLCCHRRPMPEQSDAPNFINLAGEEDDAAAVRTGHRELDALDLVVDDDVHLALLLPDGPAKLTVPELFGQAILRLRLYRSWTQRDLQRTCGVHQSQISRLESGKSPGLSMRRVYAILRALHADCIDFLPAKPAVPPTALELLLWGDQWERAGRAAERRRLSRRRSA
jgi:transcriptional regulator with XRE-family HTH domain